MIIRSLQADDWNTVADIYRQGILTGNATFETQVPNYTTWDKKYHAHLRWVAVVDQKIAGWAALSAVSVRKVYEGVAEVSLYIDQKYRGQGIGKKLLQHLIPESEAAGVWTLYAAIFEENIASIHLHRSQGFREIGYREKIAQLNGRWRNTVLLERRSKVVGV